MRFLFAVIALCASWTTSPAFAQRIAVDNTFRVHGVPGIQITETGEIGYEFAYVYKLVNLDGRLGLCGVVVSNKWNKVLRKVVGVTVAEVGGVKLKRGLNYMPNFEGGAREPTGGLGSYILSSYVWSLDPAIATGRQANCRKMSPAWNDSLTGAKVDFNLPKTVLIR